MHPRPKPLRRKRHPLRAHQHVRKFRQRRARLLAPHVRVDSAVLVDVEHAVEGVAAGGAFVVVARRGEGACYCGG